MLEPGVAEEARATDKGSGVWSRRRAKGRPSASFCLPDISLAGIIMFALASGRARRVLLDEVGAEK